MDYIKLQKYLGSLSAFWWDLCSSSLWLSVLCCVVFCFFVCFLGGSVCLRHVSGIPNVVSGSSSFIFDCPSIFSNVYLHEINAMRLVFCFFLENSKEDNHYGWWSRDLYDYLTITRSKIHHLICHQRTTSQYQDNDISKGYNISVTLSTIWYLFDYIECSLLSFCLREIICYTSEFCFL